MASDHDAVAARGPVSEPDRDRERRLYEILADYFAAVEAGRAPDRAEWLARYPDWAEEIAAFLDEQDRLLKLIEPFRPATGPTSPIAARQFEWRHIDVRPPDPSDLTRSARWMSDAPVSGRSAVVGRGIPVPHPRSGPLIASGSRPAVFRVQRRPATRDAWASVVVRLAGSRGHYNPKLEKTGVRSRMESFWVAECTFCRSMPRGGAWNDAVRLRLRRCILASGASSICPSKCAETSRQ